MADNDTTHAIELHLVEAHALALAQFVKRVGWSDFRTNAVDDAKPTKFGPLLTHFSGRWRKPVSHPDRTPTWPEPSSTPS